MPGAAAAAETMRAGELIADAHANLGRHAGADGRFERRLPPRSRCQLGIEVRRIGRLGADNAIAAETVAERHWYDRLDHARLGQGSGIGDADVAGRNIDVENARQDELQGAALGAHHHVDAARVAHQVILELLREQQQQRDGADAKRQQGQIERRVERPPAQIGQRK